MSAKRAKGGLSEAKRRWLRHQANNVVAQLPEDKTEALYVLDYARRLVIEFLHEEAELGPRPVDTD